MGCFHEGCHGHGIHALLWQYINNYYDKTMLGGSTTLSIVCKIGNISVLHCNNEPMLQCSILIIVGIPIYFLVFAMVKNKARVHLDYPHNISGRNTKTHSSSSYYYYYYY